MKTINEVCQKVMSSFPFERINQIIEFDEKWSIVLCDKYGNSLDISPVDVWKNDTEKYSDDDLDKPFHMGSLAVPKQYCSIKDIVAEMLVNDKKILPFIKRPFEVTLAFDMLYSKAHFSLESPELYAVGSYFIYLIDFLCDEEERKNVEKIMRNPFISDFLESDEQEKLQQSISFYWTPDYLNNYVSYADELLHFALQVNRDEPLNRVAYEACKARLINSKESLIEKILHEENEFFARDYWTQFIEQLDEQLLLEYAFCEGTSTEKSKRMAEMLEQDKLFSEEFSTLGETDLFDSSNFKFDDKEQDKIK